MTKSRKPLNIDLKNIHVTEEVAAPVDVMNTMLVYDDFDPINGHGAVPLVSTLFNSIKTQKDARLKKLLTAIVNGKPGIVEAMLERDPSLLLEKLDEDDYVTALSGQRSNNATAYRTALAVEDTQMVTLIKNKLRELTGSDDVANTQYRDQFPDGWEAAERERWKLIFTTLDSLKDAIRDAKPDDIKLSYYPVGTLKVKERSDVAVVLALFRSQLNALLDEVVTKGRHFNPDLLLKAFKMYDDHYRDDFGNNWKDPHAMLFWQQGIGTIQRSLPVNYVQAFCDGLDITEEKLRHNRPQDRSLEISLFDTRVWVPTDFYPLSRSRLGFDYAIYGTAWDGSGSRVGSAPGGAVWRTFVNFSRLMSIKNSVHADICTPPTPIR